MHCQGKRAYGSREQIIISCVAGIIGMTFIEMMRIGRFISPFSEKLRKSIIFTYIHIDL